MSIKSAGDYCKHCKENISYFNRNYYNIEVLQPIGICIIV